LRRGRDPYGLHFAYAGSAIAQAVRPNVDVRDRLKYIRDVNATEVVRRELLDSAQLNALRTWADEVEAWPTGSHVWGHYAEHTANGPRICRTENVSACHPGIGSLVSGVLANCAADALGEPVVAFKDKVNYKQPGGAGFSPHQDKVAYPGVGRVMSILVAIDDCSVESGCLWIAGDVHEVLPVDDRGVVRADIADALDWMVAELASGDGVCIDGLAPHYSETNRGGTPRRVLVASYAPVSEQYTREHYYAQRSEHMRAETERDGRFRISTLADFDGAQVATVAVTGACTHA
jgi:hypothetical protein